MFDGRDTFELGRLPRLPAHLRPRGQRDPHRRRTTATSPTSTSPRCAREGAIYVELIASPDHAAAVGLTDAEHYGGIAQGIDDARADHGIEARIARRPRSATSASRRPRTSPAASPTTAIPYVVGFNLAGDEAGYPPQQFAARLRDRVGARGSAARSTRASTRAPNRSAARSTLPVTRISHGVRAIEDPALVAEIAERGIVLEVCPTSNVATGVYPSYEDHPLGALHEAGVRVTLGSDDPPYFGA